MKNTALNVASALSLPLDIAGQAICIFGIRGSGKTNTAGVLAEELLDHGQPIVVIDPTDAWWGLRAGRDGSTEGGYQIFIFGGSHADVPLEETDGKVIAEFLVKEQVSVILSLRHLRKGGQRRFVTEFCEEIYHLKGRDENRTPLTVFIDEAPLFAPQKVTGEVARTVGAVEDLIARGRNAGFGVVLISQRSATLNADVRTQADTMICHRVTAALDRTAIKGWFEENASVEDLSAILKSLAGLKNGEGWVWSPALDVMSKVQMRLRRTYDSSKTPKIGERIRTPKRLVDIDLGKLREKMTAAIEQKKAENPKELRKRIAELEQAAREVAPAVDPKEIQERENAARKESALSVYDTLRKPLESVFDLLSAIAKLVQDGETDIRLLRSAMDFTDSITKPAPRKLTEAENARLDEAVERVYRGRIPSARVALNRSVEPEGESITHSAYLGKGENLPGSERKLLIALAQFPDGLSIQRLSFLSGYTINGRFNNLLGGLRTRGLISPARVKPITITDAGKKALGSYEALPTGGALREYWIEKVGSSEGRVLRILIDAYPKAVPVDQLASRAGYTVNGRFNNILGHLRSVGLMTPARTPPRASEELF